MKQSTCWKVLAALAALAAAGAAVCWLLRSKKKGCCLCGATDDGDFSYNGECSEDEQTAPCEEFSDGTAAEEPAED